MVIILRTFTLALILFSFTQSQAALSVTPSPAPAATSKGDASALVRHSTDDKSGNTRLREVAGWSVHIRRELLDGQAKDTELAIQMLRQQLEEIVRTVPAAAVKQLQQVPLYFSPEYPGRKPTAEFHPDEGWLRANGRNTAMAKAVEFSNIPQFRAEMNRMPNFALHELAHAYHYRVLPGGYANPDLKTAFERAKASGKYNRVERWHGNGKPNTFERAYAMNNAMEYFAEASEAFFSKNDYYPFNRDELKTHDPDIFMLLEKLWGTTNSNVPKE